MNPRKRLLPWRIVGRTWRYLRARWQQRRAANTPPNAPPLRAELFSSAQMEAHGRKLALNHRVRFGKAPDQLLARLSSNERALLDACELLSRAVASNRQITPAGEWLLDNFYLIEEQINIARRHLPKGYSWELPQLAEGPSRGLPRVYDIALETIAHSDARVDAESIRRVVAAYQTISPLTLGELWAIPIMLRLALIENLRRAADRTAAGRRERNVAIRWATRMIAAAENDPKNLILVTADMARSDPPIDSPFVSELTRRLQGHGSALALPLTWMQQHLAESGLTIEQLVQAGNQSQAADQVSVSNSIGSLRFLGVMDWREFVDAMSLVEQTLRTDPAGVYAQMDFVTRDQYRHVIESLANRCALSQAEIARHAVELATKASADDERRRHVGYYLIDAGLPLLRHSITARLGVAGWLRHIGQRLSVFGYLGSIAVSTALLSIAVLQPVRGHGLGLGHWLLLGTLLVIALSEFAIALVNWLATRLAIPQPLPRMDYSKGLPATARTLVVVPTLLTDSAGVHELLLALEVHFLANRDRHLHFALLTDFTDAASATLPQDEALLQLASTRIGELNAKYGDGKNQTFFLLHRPRLWNERERVWMGYERKRGKLGDLNALLRGNGRERFACIVGDITPLTEVRYVITLDTDTRLPRDSARELVAALMHPLNRAVFDARAGRVVAGYGILQPRIAVSLSGSNRSRYARMHSGDSGLDPYTRVVSDVYQDLFDEGSFIGKGIYEVDAFERALNGRFPANRILSHDLLEGNYARSGLLSDVQLYEDYPARYSADVKRRHRWIRGDWQILAWLLPWVPNASGSYQRNPLSSLSRWKILDNLRRSLIPPALLGVLLLGWSLAAPAWLFSATVLGIVLIPALCISLLDLLRKPAETHWSAHLRGVAASVGGQLFRAAFQIACLPYETYYHLDAILRTLLRMVVTRRNLLEWQASSIASATPAESWASALRAMWIAPALALLSAFVLLRLHATALPFAVPLLLLWLVAPLWAWWLSRPLQRDEVRISASQTLFLGQRARRTWGFFEHFVNADENWLPPDNYQEQPVGVIAHRTSPTNIGMALLANLSAHDFGYIVAGELLARTAATFATLQKLERYRGHFYNWYDTIDLQPLQPMYVSTVDSGNLAGHLLTLRPGLCALLHEPILARRWAHGLRDTFGLLAAASADASNTVLAEFSQTLGACEAAPELDPGTARARLQQLGALAATLQTQFAVGNDEQRRWSAALAQQCAASLAELELLAPWSALPAPPPNLADLWPHPCIPSLHEIVQWAQQLAPRLTALRLEKGTDAAAQDWLERCAAGLAQSAVVAQQRAALIDRLAQQCNEFARIEYDFLYDEARHLLAIGYNVSERRLDASFYDLLASEARLCNFVAIAQGELPQESWFALGRLLATAEGEPMLLSWSGSMFEYLMPLLVMPTYANSLLDQTYRAAVHRQIEYARSRNVPWGISESGYNTVDAAMNYQYRAFGVPGTGLKRGLAEDLVIAPYATALALMVEPELACTNLQQLAALGFEGAHGFYEAIDYTPARVPRGQTHAIVRSYMAHHQGMSLLSFAYLLLDQPMQRRFVSDPFFQATLLLLQERIPKPSGFFVQPVGLADIRESSVGTPMPIRILSGKDTPLPEVQLLSNGRYHVMVSNAGGGYSRWKDLAVTRWREDGTCDSWGNFCYLREVGGDTVWSSALQPTLTRAETQEAIFSEARVEFRRRDGDFETHTEIVVSPEDDIELRRVRITNCSRTRRSIEITSYAEVVLAPALADDAHPAFSNLFVQTEIVPDRRAILATRRARSLSEQLPWMFHLMAAHGARVEAISYETDRLAFLGRGHSTLLPQAVQQSGALGGGQGPVLDPIVAIRQRIVLDPEQTVTVDVVTGASESRDGCLGLIEKYQDRALADRVFELAWTHSQVVLRQIDATESDAQLYARLASSIIYANASLRADAGIIAANRRGQSGLWGYAISGDLPIVLVQIHDVANVDLVRQMVQAHTYWRLKGLAVDLVIWNEEQAGYRQQLQDHVVGMIAAGVGASLIDKPGGIFVRHADQIASEDRILLQAVARVIIRDDVGKLAEQINQRGAIGARMPRFQPNALVRNDDALPSPPLGSGELQLDNGSGGFSADGREYVIVSSTAQRTPLPWVNVLANPQFGCVISESGQSYTWSENAHEFRLTPWQNDPVSDAAGEALYLRDEDSGRFWSPTPLPSASGTNYITRHGFGYSSFEHLEHGIHSELCVFVAADAPIKFLRLRLHNRSAQTRRLSATGYVEWVLADLRARAAMHVVTEIDTDTGALFARNAYSMEFADRVAFFDVDDPNRTLTCNRTEFIGRNGSLRNPKAMRRMRLSGKTGAGLDPCAAIQTVFELHRDEETEIVFRLGVGRNAQDASEIVRRFRKPAAAAQALTTVQEYWRDTLGKVQIETPDAALNALANGWLVYQVMACRLWARSGYYQSGGAFGFRDQLQDAMALVHAAPQLLRAQILLAGSRQFVEGDVQHWWHPPAGRGVRTRCSDDYLWLPLATVRYLEASGDLAVLDETLGFLEGRAVGLNEDSHYDLPTPSAQSANLYTHCVRAIEHGLRFGTHGLPLMGTGDWNDGMNLVGFGGKGESIWLGFFLYEVLCRFAPIARVRGDEAFAARCETQAAQLRGNLEQHGWDGAWYRRAYFDDGTPLGAATNDECRIDSIAQSWSVLSGAGEAQRRQQAMQSLYEHLVRKEQQLIQLLDPPFDSGTMDPGYIRGYVPGVRENGGQYTHAAVWATMAFAELGDSARAWELFDLINPLNHARDAAQVAVYKVEPYVVAADVYARAPHGGRGGWTWYTGSAGWMYRLILESLLGLRLVGGKLWLTPHLRADWDGFVLHYQHASTRYRIAVSRAGASATAGLRFDGVLQPEASVPLLDDGQQHAVEVIVAALAP